LRFERLGRSAAKTTTKTAASILSLVSSLSIAFAGVANAGEGAPRKGQVSVQSSAATPVAAGPAVLHVYSGFSGATVRANHRAPLARGVEQAGPPVVAQR